MNDIVIAPDVRPDAIAPDVILHPGCRLYGADLSIGPGCELGAEGPLTLRNCQLGRNVKLGGGFYDGATLLDGVNGGDQAHVRPGCLFEEEAVFGHCCGFKQTILLPFVTAGSLANFCDVLMGGGTSRKNHSEVGSSYIHFNYTPYQDKATASLVGDVPYGVRLDQPPIFLGGQGGLVGPRHITFGTLIPAGQVVRRDTRTPNLLIACKPLPDMAIPYPPPHRQNAARVFAANLEYIGNLFALDHWYRHVRRLFMERDAWSQRCHAGALSRLEQAFAERCKQLENFIGTLGGDTPGAPEETHRLLAEWPRLSRELAEKIKTRAGLPAGPLGTVAAAMAGAAPESYIAAVHGLGGADKETVTRHLQAVVRQAADLWQEP